MPPEENPLNGLETILKKIQEQQNYETDLALLKQDMENYVKETDIHKMISAKIKTYDEEQQKLDSKGINWNGIIQTVIAAVITAIIVAAVMGSKS